MDQIVSSWPAANAKKYMFMDKPHYALTVGSLCVELHIIAEVLLCRSAHLAVMYLTVMNVDG